jgi:predicted small lipoprotein YifL
VSSRPSTRGPFATRTRRSLRMVPSGRLAAVLICATLTTTAACGKKGPPLAPFVRVPASVTAVTPQRIGNDIYLSFTVPETNADGQKPADIATLEVYAVTSEIVPSTKKQRDLATLIATVPVRPILPPAPVPANGSPEPPIPLPPGVNRGGPAVVVETLTAETSVAVELPVEKPRNVAERVVAETDEKIGTLVAPPPTQLPRRHYFIVATSPRGRESVPSTPVSVALEGGSSAPGAPEVVHDVATLTLTWAAPPDARTSTFLLPPTVKPVAAGANVTPANVTPVKGPAPLPPLTAKSLGFNSVATAYHVYDVTPVTAPTNTTPAAPPPSPAPETLEENPFAIRLPVALTPAPVVDRELVLRGVVFGVERCFEVRPVDQVFGSVVIGPPSPRTCVTPKDTYPPVAPTSLAAIAAPGVISLIWDANAEPDLAGYIVLRGEAPGATLQALNTEPVTANTYRDETVRPGTRYVYVVVAVDNAVPQNVSPQSNRVEETARQ